MNGGPRSNRLAARLRTRLAIGLGAGLLAGSLIGAVIGALVFGTGTGGFWAATVAGTIFVTAVTLLLAGYASLESPDPGAEPSQDARPVADRSDLTRVEHPVTDRSER
jgi:hypothetical protein